MVKPVFESAIAGLHQASARFERSAAQVTRLAAAESADPVDISRQARGAAQGKEKEASPTLESAIVDTRIAKYQFMANLRVLQTGDEMSREVAKLVSK